MSKAQQHYREHVLPLVEAERLDLADFLETLDEPEWQVTSLCPEWTVHDVLAHLTLSTRQTVPATIRRVLRARGDFDQAEARWAVERGTEFGPAELLGQLRQTAGSTHRLAVSGPLDPLVDILVHGQDIARPLGRVRPMPTQRVVPALEYAWQARFYNARKRFAGLRLVATDADFSVGDSELAVRGPVSELLLTATGRAAGLAGLTGSGLETLTARMAPNGVVSP